MTYDDLLRRLQAEQLTIFGSLRGAQGTILLLGPHEPGFGLCFVTVPSGKMVRQILWTAGHDV